MYWAAKNGHLEIVQWLHFNRNEGCTKYSMDWAANSGHVEIVKWLNRNIDWCSECRGSGYWTWSFRSCKIAKQEYRWA